MSYTETGFGLNISVKSYRNIPEKNRDFVFNLIQAP